VFTPAPGGGTSASFDLTVENPLPVLTSIAPDEIDDVDVTGDVEITLTGTDFVPDSVVELDGVPVATVYVSSTELTATRPEADIAAAGTYDITVVNATPGGGETSPQTFETVDTTAPLSITNHIGARTGASASGSFTPANNTLLVAIVTVCQNSGATDPSADIGITDSAGLTWTPRVTIGTATSWSRGLRIFTAPVTTGVSMTVTGSLGGGRTLYTLDMQVFSLAGYDAGSPVGATASDGALAGGAGTKTITLNGTPAASSIIIAGAIVNCTAASAGLTHGTGWTEQSDFGGGNIQSQSQSITGHTSTSVIWDAFPATFSSSNQGGAIEIKKA
jgi:hypothetical protein